jgi:serine protease Do
VSAIDELEQSVRSVAEVAGPSVVGIGNRWAVGSGIVVGPGKVVTNAHNVRREEMTVTFADGQRAAGRAAGVDVDGDVAVVDVDTGDAPALEWADGVSEFGRIVFALSNPGGRGLRATFGVVSGTQRSFRGPRGRKISGSLEHTAPLLPGSSGGPVVDADGRLLAINTNRLGEGFYLAIPADASLRANVDSLSSGEVPERVRLGIAAAPPHVARGLRRAVGLPDADGLLVREVEDESPAAAGGLEEGDLIVAIGGGSVDSIDVLYDALGEAQTGSTLELTVLRGTEERTVVVTF